MAEKKEGLQGKASEAFRAWMLNKSVDDYKREYVDMVVGAFDGFIFGKFHAFQCSSEAEQWGVILNWADSEDIQVVVDVYFVDVNYIKWHFTIHYNEGLEHFESDEYDTRPEARKAAINKLSELYNENH